MYFILGAFEEAMQVAETLIGSDRVVKDIAPNLAGEDFSFYLQKSDGAYAYLGIRNESAGSTHL